MRQRWQPLLRCRVGVVDIPRLAENAAADIEIARTWKPGTVPNTLPPRNDQD
ncbi:MAG TPA: hypothetical protein VFE31_07030 [Opitutaceae bacterium]|jgi:hypothetical protein|nr:hypothetical protein [Opitutaceae bacterium]